MTLRLTLIKLFQPLLILQVAVPCAFAQLNPYKWSAINVGVTPGVSTNGMHPKNYANNVSFNLFSGYSAALSGFEISGISSFHTNSSSGVQFSGIANVVGGNRKDLKEYTASEQINLASNFYGLQLSGLVNSVAGSFGGIQIAGLTNLSLYGDVTGVQIAGLVNYVYGYVEGFQISFLENFSKMHITGAQVAMVLNRTDGGVYGAQFATWNVAKTLYGPKSDTKIGSGLQIGIVNIASQIMDGYQIGVINNGGNSRGFQIGIVNYNYRTVGYSIGLLNLGKGRMGIKITSDNISQANIHLLTGSKKLTNTLLLGSEVGESRNGDLVFGYGLGRTNHLRKGRIFAHYELMTRMMAVNAKTFKFLPIASFNSYLALHIRGGIYASLGLGINYDFQNYLNNKNNWFPSWSIGLAALE